MVTDFWRESAEIGMLTFNLHAGITQQTERIATDARVNFADYPSVYV